MIVDLNQEESKSLLEKLYTNKKEFWRLYKNWTKIYHLEKVKMPVSRGIIGVNYKTELIDSIRVYHDFLLYGDKQSGWHYIYKHNNDGYDIFDSFLTTKIREEKLTILNI